MNSTADLGGIFKVLDITALAFAQIVDINERDKTLGDRLDSDLFRGGNGPSRVYFQSCFENVHTR